MMLSPEALALYRETRGRQLALFNRRFGSPGASTALSYARREAAARAAFARWEARGLVRIVGAADDCPHWEDPEGPDGWAEDARHEPGANLRAIAAAVKAERAAAERGAWGIVGEYRVRPSDDWETAHSVWGFYGEEPEAFGIEGPPYYLPLAEGVEPYGVLIPRDRVGCDHGADVGDDAVAALVEARDALAAQLRDARRAVRASRAVSPYLTSQDAGAIQRAADAALAALRGKGGPS